MDNNISRILYEVENNIQWIATSLYNFSFEEFTKSTASASYLAMAFLTNYERPADPFQPERGTQAMSWFEYLGDVSPPTPLRNKKFKWVLYVNKLRKRRI